MFKIAPDFCPDPIARGTFQTDPCSYFYICKFYEMPEGVPEPRAFCEKVAKLHSAHTSPEGKFGFHVTTYNGNLPQDNTWSSSWEECFTNGMKNAFKVYRERAGPQPELEAMLPGFYSKVIPRLLRPLESDGRKLQPSFVHGDLWCGNAAIIDEDTKDGIAFDPASFWAHNECLYALETRRLVSLSWAVQRGIPVVPKTTSQSRMIENSTIRRLPDELFEQVNKVHLETGQVRFMNVTAKFGFDIFDETVDEPV